MSLMRRKVFQQKIRFLEYMLGKTRDNPKTAPECRIAQEALDYLKQFPPREWYFKLIRIEPAVRDKVNSACYILNSSPDSSN